MLGLKLNHVSKRGFWEVNRCTKPPPAEWANVWAWYNNFAYKKTNSKFNCNILELVTRDFAKPYQDILVKYVFQTQNYTDYEMLFWSVLNRLTKKRLLPWLTKRQFIIPSSALSSPASSLLSLLLSLSLSLSLSFLSLHVVVTRMQLIN